MKTEKEITDAITKLTLEIREKYHEMSKYIGEMPVTNPNAEHPEINEKILTEYYNELLAIMKRYAQEHEELEERLKDKEKEDYEKL